MPSKIYNWKRFWCPREGRINLGSRGFLIDPDDEYGKALNPDLVTPKDIIDVPCLVLLGEPGIGKSTTIKTQKEYLDKQVQENGGKTLWFDLRKYQTDLMLKEEIFKNPVYLDWLNNDYNLYLYLDSLDECLLHIKTISALLSEEFIKHPDKKCFLRIACRTAVWPQTFEENLINHWREENVKVYELAPLRLVDVENAAKKNGLSPDDFINNIIEAEVTPLACSPVTLNFLINIYMKQGNLPSKKIDIYRDGCRLLCEESKQRKEAGARRELNADERLIIASRIAAITIFSRKDAVWKGIDEGNVPDEDIKEIDISGKFEIVNGEKVSVNEAAISETLDTGLFNSRGPNRMGWAHQTYAEFLAANYLYSNEIPLNQIISLITHPNGKLIPQLYETSAWVASMRNDVFQEIIMIEPEVLLQSDAACIDEDSRKALTAELLRRFDEGTAGDNYLTYHAYRKLKHKTLSEQLRPYILDKDKNPIARRAAIDIARYCEEKDLLSELLNVALDKNQLIHLRDNAVSAIAKIGNKDAKAKLMPLAQGIAGDDPEDELKGLALRALWPDHISAKELFGFLTHPKNSHHLGAYDMFISHELAKQLKPNDLPDALKWVEKHVKQNVIHNPFENLSESIMRLAFDNLEIPAVFESFARAVFSRIKKYDQKIVVLLMENEERRRSVVKQIILLMSDPNDAGNLIFPPLVTNIDLKWLIEQLTEAESERDQQIYSKLIVRTFIKDDVNQINAVLIASENNEVLKNALAYFINPIQLNSMEAIKAKEEYYRHQELFIDRKKRLLDPPPEERILQRLNLFESGELMAFWYLTMELTLEPDSNRYGSEFGPLVMNLPGWKKANNNIKTRILYAAQEYILNGDPLSEEWIGTEKINYSAMAGYKALLLLLTEKRSFLDSLKPEVWKKWAPTILAYPTGSGFDEDKYYQALVEKAYTHTSDETINTLLILIDKENEKYDNLFILRKVENCWDDKMKSNLFEKIKDKRLKPKCWNHLLTKLFEHNVAGVRVYADSLICVPPPSCEDNRLRMLFSLYLLFIYCGRSVWPTISYIIHEDRKFGRELFEMIASEDRNYGTSQEPFLEEQLSELYIWIHKEYPDVEMEKMNGRLTAPNYIADFKRGIRNNLAARGTFEACDAICKIMKEFPDLDWLKWTLWDAEKNARRGTWTPLKSNEILELIKDPNKRVIENEDGLLSLVIESLERFEREVLHGQTIVVNRLWNEPKDGHKKIYTPKEEETLSDEIKLHIENDLRVIVNREAKVHRGFTDVKIDALKLNTSTMYVENKLTVIIEVKGCWHPDVNTAMENQLINRYLPNATCNHGIYLVGWFDCNKCYVDEEKKNRCPLKNMSLIDIRDRFDKQAKELSEKFRMDIRAIVLDCSRH